MAKSDPTTVDEYIAAQPAAAKSILERVRSTIRKAIPDAEEVISYKIPAYKQNSRAVIYFAGWKQHYSVYPATAQVVAAYKDELARYEVNKGTIRFPLSQPVPVKLIERIAKLLAEEVAEREKAKPRPAAHRAGGKTRKQSGAVEHIAYHKDGSVWARGLMLDGTPTGYWEWFRNDGTRMRSGSFESGQQVGQWTTYDRKGEVYKVTNMKVRSLK